MGINYVTNKKPSYTSKYGSTINKSVNKIAKWKYDPLKDASYQALAQVYNARGEAAAQNALGNAAALNGGMSTSNAVSAAAQAQNQYNQELSSMVPELEQAALNREQTKLSALTDAENTRYAKYRDKMSDYQWGKGYNATVYSAKKVSSGGSRRRSSGGSSGYSSGSSYSGGSSSGSSATQDSAPSLYEQAKKNAEKKSNYTGKTGAPKK